MPEISFGYRVGFLLVMLGTVAAWDYRKYGPAATKWREYGFLCSVALISACFAIANDFITASISPDYFVSGKGLSLQEFIWELLKLATEAGFSAGIVIGALLLFVNSYGTRGAPPHFARLYKLLLFPTVGAVIGGISLGLISAQWDPLHFAGEVDFLENAAAQARFVLVWGVHTGLYAGALMGLLLAAWRLRKFRASTAV